MNIEKVYLDTKEGQVRFMHFTYSLHNRYFLRCKWWHYSTT
jgi:hypothetical protein